MEKDTQIPWRKRIEYVPAPVDSAPLRIQVYERLVKLITEGNYSPGDRLPEPELSKLLSVSRGPIREALQLLEYEGYVEVRPRHGATVRRRTLKEISDYFQTRRVLEVHAAKQAALNLTVDNAKVLRDLMEAAYEANRSDNSSTLMAANWAVHRAIPHMSGNDALSEMIDTLGKRIRWYTLTSHSWRRAPAVLVEHQGIVEAICDRDVELVEKRMDEHIGQTWSAYTQWVAKQNSGKEVIFAPQPDA